MTILKYIFCALATLLLLSMQGGILFAQEKEDSVREIKVTDEGFDPINTSIPVGTKIIFRNIGKNPHWPASNIHPTHEIYPEFDPQQPISALGSWEFTFQKVGEWRFHDHLYPNFTGNIYVIGDEGVDQKKEQKIIQSPFLSKLKFGFWNSYFYFFPQDKELYVSKQNISRIAHRKDEAKIEYLISLVGPEKVIENLFNQSGKGTRSNCHVAAHTVGRVAFISLNEKAVQKNITLCHSGYQHGVMAAFINKHGARNLIERLNQVCEKADSDFGKLTCYHGVGHGLMGYYDNHLPTAISRCMNLGERFKQNNCMVGVFMENIGSKVGDSISNHPTEWLKEEDMHFPCNAIDQNPQIQSMCYSIQPDWMNNIYKNDFNKIAGECMKVPEQVRSSCFFGMGQEIALAANFQPQKIVEYCSLVPNQNDFSERCYIGSETVILDYWGPNLTDQGVVYCNALPEFQIRRCYEVLNSRLKDFGRSN